MLKETEQAINDLVDKFCKDYDFQFDGWIGDNIGEVFGVNDYYTFNFTDVLTCYREGISRDRLIEWYEYMLEAYENKEMIKYNLENFAKLK